MKTSTTQKSDLTIILIVTKHSVFIQGPTLERSLTPVPIVERRSIHTEECPYKCSYCNKTFSIHTRTHTGKLLVKINTFDLVHSFNLVHNFRVTKKCTKSRDDCTLNRVWQAVTDGPALVQKQNNIGPILVICLSFHKLYGWIISNRVKWF